MDTVVKLFSGNGGRFTRHWAACFGLPATRIGGLAPAFVKLY